MEKDASFRGKRKKSCGNKAVFFLTLFLLPLTGIFVARLQYLLLDSPGGVLTSVGIAAGIVLLYFVLTPWLESRYDLEIQRLYLSEIPARYAERFRRLEQTLHNAYYSEAFRSHLKLEKTALSKLPVAITARFDFIKYALHTAVHLAVFFALLPQFFLPALVLLGLSFFAKYRLYRKRVDFHLGNVEEDRVAEYFRNLLLDVRAMHDIQVFGAEDAIAGQSISAFESGLEKRYRLRRKNAVGYPVVKAVSALAVGLIVLGIATGFGVGSGAGFGMEWVDASQGPGLAANLPRLVVALTAVLGVLSQMDPLCDKYFAYREARTLWKACEDSERAYPKYRRDGLILERIEEIRFEDVSFAYESGRPILKNLNFVWKMDAGMSLIGENGAGKTTLVKLLLGIHAPTSGAIYINGVPLSAVDIRSYHHCLGFCMQDFAIFSDDIGSNITFGDASNEKRLEEMMQSEGEILPILSFLSDLPEGLRTKLGPELYERGVVLSGGQEQRVALARALVRGGVVDRTALDWANSAETDFQETAVEKREAIQTLTKGDAAPTSILVLDEPTAALDPEMEHSAFRVFSKLAEAQPVFLITHRIGYASLCGRIVVLEDGRIVEDGSHEALMNQKGRYYEMYQTQSRMYRVGSPSPQGDAACPGAEIRGRKRLSPGERQGEPSDREQKRLDEQGREEAPHA